MVTYDFVEYRLEQWAAWSAGGHGLGFPRMSVEGRAMKGGGGGGNTMHCPDHVALVERVVLDLSDEHKALLINRYIKRRPLHRLVKGIPRSTARRRLMIAVFTFTRRAYGIAAEANVRMSVYKVGRDVV